ncbi:methyltransferase family protein [Cohaesibacter intestini]|uniref:methyltransferase family protein n=1 Tax=Cohaesibacter intestini TaxID=2211145 RepID=UPI000DEA7C2C|nr:isoprenylcysteine carboxylmethyltransferase family protein [Cohaesibacter intestini]
MIPLLPPALTALLTIAPLSLLGLPAPSGLQIAPFWLVWTGAALCIPAGLLIALVGKIQFHRNDSEIHPFRTPRNLVTGGLFRISRNPMYLGFLLHLTGIALLVNLWPALLAPLAFFAAANLWYIPHEEQAAIDSFGEAYITYCNNVRRWL